MAFFPCTRFEELITLSLKGEAFQQKNWTNEQKLECSMRLHTELHENYMVISKLSHVCISRKIKLVIENPAGQSGTGKEHYLCRYWCLKPSLIDKNRRERGDYQVKPTQYWFINFKPKQNFIFEPLEAVEYRTHNGARARDGKSRAVMRSMIHPQYANRFIREFIL